MALRSLTAIMMVVAVCSVRAAELLVPDQYATIAAAIGGASPGDTLRLGPGTYAEIVVVPVPLTILGPNAGIDGADPLRDAEAVIIPPVSWTPVLLAIRASDVTVDGVLLDGDNQAVSSGTSVNGVDADASRGVANDPPGFPARERITVRNCVLRNFAIAGIHFTTTGASAPASSGSIIEQNLVDNVPLGDSAGTGISLAYNFYATVTRNTVSRAWIGVSAAYFYRPGGPAIISANAIDASGIGIWLNLHRSRNASETPEPFVVERNRITGPAGATGVFLSSILEAAGASLRENRVSGTGTGLRVWNIPTPTTVQSFSDSIEGCGIGVWLSNFAPEYGPGGASRLVLQDPVVRNSSAAAISLDDHEFGTATVALALTGVAEVEGGADGIRIEGTRATVSLEGVRFSGLAGQYLALLANGAGSFPAGDLDARTVLFDGQTGVATENAGLFAIEDRITHALDLPGPGLVRVKAGALHVTPASGSIQRAVDKAVAGDTVFVAPGTFAEVIQVPASLVDVAIVGPNAGIPLSGRGPEAVVTGGIRLAAPLSSVAGLTVQGGASILGEVAGIYVDGGIGGCAISDNILQGPPSGPARGILFGYNVLDARVERNTITGWTSGLYLNPRGPSGTLEIIANEITDNAVGIGSDGINAVLIRRNRIIQNQVEGWGYSDAGGTGGTGLVADSNEVSGNGSALNNSSTEDTIVAENNFWGSDYGPSDPQGSVELPFTPEPPVVHMLNAAPVGLLGDPVSEAVDYFPWTGEEIGTTETQMVAGWNLVSVPRIPVSFASSTLFPGAEPGTVYKYRGILPYDPIAVLENGEGYWALYSTASLNTITGTTLTSWTRTIEGGNEWILLGSISLPATLRATPASAVDLSTLQSFNGESYQQAGVVEPGRGYWLFVSEPCTLEIIP